jgi:hypothetical protein
MLGISKGSPHITVTSNTFPDGLFAPSFPGFQITAVPVFTSALRKHKYLNTIKGTQVTTYILIALASFMGGRFPIYLGTYTDAESCSAAAASLKTQKTNVDSFLCIPEAAKPYPKDTK